MTREQSYLNLQKLLNFIRPYNCEHIFFDFTSETEFRLVFYTQADWGIISEHMRDKDLTGLPYGRMRISKNEPDELYYFDKTADWDYNLTANSLDFFTCTERRNSMDMKKVAQQFAELLRKLENS